MPKKKIIDPERELPKVQRMLYKAAHAAKNKRFPFEEALTEAYWAFMECCRTYKPDKGMKFSSYVFYRVNYHLRTHITKQVKESQRMILMEINDDLLGESPLRRSLEEALENRPDLDKDERELLRLIINPPRDIATIHYTWEDAKEVSPADFVRQLKRHLGFERGVDSTYVDITLHNLKAKLENRNLSFS